MNDNSYKILAQRITGYREQVIQMQTELTSIPALAPENKGEGETKKAEHIKELLRNFSCDWIEEVNAPDNRVPSGYRPNLLAKMKGKSDKKTIWIMSHMDVVPVGDLSQWDTDPYQVTEKNGKLYGRGTEDDQQGIISSILAVKALQEEKIRPAFDIGLVLVSDEETGSQYGIDFVLKNKPDLIRPEDFIIIPDAGDDQGTMIEVAEKSILWIQCNTLGKQTHGSTPEKGANAHSAAAHFIVKMKELYRIYSQKNPLFDPPLSTFEPTKKESNVENINIIPGKDVCYFDCRILPDTSVEEVQKTIRLWANDIEKEFRVKINLTYPQVLTAPPPTPPDAPVVHALQIAIRDVMGRTAKTVGIGGGTVAAFFRKMDLPAVCWCTVDDTLHTPNEYCKIDNVLNDARVFTHIFLQD
ncbi:M20 family metallo-hydrolase [bacterium]|nr:M20 family metallo-hydrolase [bacterium]